VARLEVLCKQLAAKFGSFAEVLAASPHRLAEIKGPGAMPTLRG
jgi:DNA repair protein RadC